MSVGAVTGKGVYSVYKYKGKDFRLSQWTNDAMDAVSEAAYLRTAEALQMLGGKPSQIAERELALARSFALGGYNFDSVVADSNDLNADYLLSMFLYKLLVGQDATIRYELAAEMVKADKRAVREAISKANPLKEQQTDEAGLTAPEQPANPSSETGNPSERQ